MHMHERNIMAVLYVHGVIYLHGLISLESWQKNLVWWRFLKWRVGEWGGPNNEEK